MEDGRTGWLGLLARRTLFRGVVPNDAASRRTNSEAPAIVPAEPPKPAGASILDAYVKDPPGPALAFNIFEGEWSSIVPGYGGGYADLFNDHRVKWFETQCGGFRGKRILELGPLEGGHTRMMASAGAASVTAIESNTRAFLKCLIVQNALKFDADFRLGDFVPYLASCTESYDVLVASGVLYHMSDPAQLLTNAARVSSSICLWTHYYDADVISNNEALRKKFDAAPRVRRVGGRDVICHQQTYLQALNWQGFCGGSAPTSYWLTKESLLGLLADLGFSVTVGDETTTHPNGPAMTLFASRN